MSFWTVPPSSLRGTPVSLPDGEEEGRGIGAVALIVIEMVAVPRGIPRKSRRMSSSESMATPTRPTSPRALEWSAS